MSHPGRRLRLLMGGLDLHHTAGLLLFAREPVEGRVAPDLVRKLLALRRDDACGGSASVKVAMR